MLRKFAVLFSACVLCQCKADDARAPAGETPAPQAAPAPPVPEAEVKQEQPSATPSEENVESERPKSGSAAAPAVGEPVLPAPAKKPATGARDGLKSEPPTGTAFKGLGDAEAAFKAADQQLDRLYVVSGKASQLTENDDRCVRACGAFSSLERAAGGVCRLAGERDARCTKARDRVSYHKAKIAACSCSDG